MGIAALVLFALLVVSVVYFVVRIISAIVKTVRAASQNKTVNVNWKKWLIWQGVLVLVAIASFVALVTVGGFALVGLVVGLF